MRIKGVDKLRAKLPTYVGWRWVGLGVLIAVGTITGLTFMLLVDSVARLCSHISFFVLIEPLLPVLGALTCELVAFRLIWSVWHNRNQYLAEFGDLAYQKVIPRGFVGVAWIFALCMHIYVPLDVFPIGPPVNSVTTLLAGSLLAVLGVPAVCGFMVRVVGSISLLVLGVLTIRSALLTFGVDYLAMVYLYYPTESEVQQHEIYSVLRHPTYFGVLAIAAGGMALRCSLYSLVFFVVFLLGLLVHIFCVEEKELRERFGTVFIEYQKRVPALYVRARDIRVFLRFLAKRGTA
ncbi:MAG: methyltransferase family protein [Promethearchaeota archaeon]